MTINNEQFDCSFEIFANKAAWGRIEGDISAQIDLQEALDAKADDTEITDIDGRLDNIEGTLSGYGNIVTHNVSEFATAAQGALADSAIQPNDNISELTNNAGYITKAVNNLTYYTTTTDLNTALSAKQDVISDLATIRAGASAGATALQGEQYGTIIIDI